MVTKPIDGKPATTLNGGTIGFLMSDAKQAEAWHNAGVANLRACGAGPVLLPLG
jgi:hypothetical protein